MDKTGVYLTDWCVAWERWVLLPDSRMIIFIVCWWRLFQFRSLQIESVIFPDMNVHSLDVQLCGFRFPAQGLCMCADFPMKYILVTGGVISGIGKGIIASSIGTILKSCGLRVTAIKIDPYINIDAGTFSPYEHGMKISAVLHINICIYSNVFWFYFLKTNSMVFTSCFIIILKVCCLLCVLKDTVCSKLRNRSLCFWRYCYEQMLPFSKIPLHWENPSCKTCSVNAVFSSSWLKTLLNSAMKLTWNLSP